MRPCQLASGRAVSTVAYVPQEDRHEWVREERMEAAEAVAEVVPASSAYRARDLPHRALAAFAAIRERLRRLSFLALRGRLSDHLSGLARQRRGFWLIRMART